MKRWPTMPVAPSTATGIRLLCEIMIGYSSWDEDGDTKLLWRNAHDGCAGVMPCARPAIQAEKKSCAFLLFLRGLRVSSLFNVVAAFACGAALRDRPQPTGRGHRDADVAAAPRSTPAR